MSNIVDMTKLKFGNEDAELDESFGFLDKVFLKTSIYQRVREHNRELVIGRKGAGKSAIFLMLKKALESDGAIVMAITPEESHFQPKIKQLKVSSINEDASYIMGWKYVLLVKLAIEIRRLTQKSKIPNQRKTLKLIRKFLVENEEIEKTFFEKLFLKSGSFSALSVNFLGSGVSIQKQQQEAQKNAASDLKKFQTSLQTVLHQLAGSTAQPSVRVFILIDKVDEVWNQTAESEMMVIGLIKAIHDLNPSLPLTHIMLFLRSDIYDELKFNNKDTLHGVEERLDWREEDLKQLIANRGKVSACLETEKVDKLWNILFDPSVKGISSFDYILTRTFKRPRDLIQFCNCALSEAQNNNHPRIKASDILKAEILYSHWKLDDLASEFLVQYPYLEELLGLFQGFKADFTPEEFDIRYQEAQKRLSHDPDLQAINTDKMLQILFLIGFLGAANGGENIFVFDDSSIGLAQKERIVIHPMFHLALGLEKETQSRPKMQVQQATGIGDNARLRDINMNIVGSVLGGGNVVRGVHSTSRLAEIYKQRLSQLLSLSSEYQKQLDDELDPTQRAHIEKRLMDIDEEIRQTTSKFVDLKQDM